jgi:integrase
MDALAVTGWDLQQQALSSELSDNTRIAYRKGWSKFVDYCAAESISDPLSVAPERVASFFVQVATRPSPQSGIIPSMGTVMLYKSAVNKKYLDAGKPSPTSHPVVRSTLKGLARLRGSSTRKVEALREYHIQSMLKAAPNTPIGKRDAAIIAVGFAGALRRSEICNLNVEDVEFLDLSDDCEDRMILTIRRSKTDQHGKGQRVPILDGSAIRPISRLRQWLEGSGITEGPLFQTMKRGGQLRGKPMHHSDIPRIVKHYAELAGLNPKDIAGHSLRAGFVTSAAVHHARLDKIMAVTRHTNPATVMGYIRDADAFTDHAGRSFL